jgi:hypothetical protein
MQHQVMTAVLPAEEGDLAAVQGDERRDHTGAADGEDIGEGQ